MFSNLTHFNIPRNNKEAIGFYMAYLLVALLLGGVIGSIAGLFYPENPEQTPAVAGNLFAVILSCFLAYQLATKKSLFTLFNMSLVILLTLVLALFLGAFGGLIPAAYLSTLANKKESQTV